MHLTLLVSTTSQWWPAMANFPHSSREERYMVYKNIPELWAVKDQIQMFSLCRSAPVFQDKTNIGEQRYHWCLRPERINTGS